MSTAIYHWAVAGCFVQMIVMLGVVLTRPGPYVISYSTNVQFEDLYNVSGVGLLVSNRLAWNSHAMGPTVTLWEGGCGLMFMTLAILIVIYCWITHQHLQSETLDTNSEYGGDVMYQLIGWNMFFWVVFWFNHLIFFLLILNPAELSMIALTSFSTTLFMILALTPRMDDGVNPFLLIGITGLLIVAMISWSNRHPNIRGFGNDWGAFIALIVCQGFIHIILLFAHYGDPRTSMLVVVNCRFVYCFFVGSVYAIIFAVWNTGIKTT